MQHLDQAIAKTIAFSNGPIRTLENGHERFWAQMKYQEFDTEFDMLIKSPPPNASLTFFEG
jgi:hypothetical protein